MSGELYEVLGQLRYTNKQRCPKRLKDVPVRLKTKEGEIFEITAQAACVSRKLRTIVVESGVEDEIPLPLSKDLSTKMIEYMKYHATTPSGEIRVPLEGSNLQECGATKWDATFVKVDKDKLYDILLASSLLEIDSLFFAASVQAALMLQERESVRIRKDFNMNNDFNQEDEEGLVELTNLAKAKKKIKQSEEYKDEELAKSAAMLAGVTTAADKLGVLTHDASTANVKSWKMANWRAAVMMDWTLLGSAPEEVRGDRDLVLAALVSSSGRALKFATDELKQDKELVLSAVACSGKSFGEAAPVLKDDKAFVHEATDIKGQAMEGASTTLRSDPDFLFELLGGDGEGSAVQGAVPELLNNEDFMLKAIAREPLAMKYAAEELQKSRDFAMKAVCANGLAIAHLHSTFKADQQIVLAAVSENPKASVFAHSARRAELGMAEDNDMVHPSLTDKDIEALGTVVHLVKAPTIKNEIEPHEVWNPYLLKSTKLVQFSAGSTMTANMGQANYVSANIFMDKLPFYERPVHDSVTIMWGAVGNIGMRWKAFASADFLNATPDALLNVAECAKILVATAVWMDPPEWYNCQLYDAFTREAILRPTAGFGSGGGYKPGEAALPPVPRSQKRGGQGGKERSNAPLGGWPGLFDPSNEADAPPPLREGSRIRLVGMGAKDGAVGTVLKEAEGGRWKVWLDRGGGNFILKPENLEIMEGQGGEAQGGRTAAVQEKQQPVTDQRKIDLSKCVAPVGPRAQEEQPENCMTQAEKAWQKQQSDAAQAWWRAQLGGFNNVIDALASVKAQVLESPPPPAKFTPDPQRCD